MAERVPVYRIQTTSRGFRGRIFDRREEPGEERVVRRRPPAFAEDAQDEHFKPIAVESPPGVRPPSARGADVV